jgi:hypothetical protein
MGDQDQTQFAAVIGIDRDSGNGNGNGNGGARCKMPLSIPTPSIQYKQHRREVRAITSTQPSGNAQSSTVSLDSVVTDLPPVVALPGPRVLMWKQDPSVQEIGIRKAFLPGFVQAGPRDARIAMGAGVPVVSPNVFGDLIQTPGSEAFDTVHTFAVVRETLTMYQRARNNGTNPAPLPWQWNSATDTTPLKVFPKAGNSMNAQYSRSERALRFFFFNKPGDPPTAPLIFTCRSLDIVAHETGHAVLDGLKPGWLGFGNPPQTGAMHEAFGDLTAIFLTLSQFDQVEAVIAQTKADLHDKSFLSDLAEQFGLALGRPNGLRNADNNLTLSQVGTEVHSLSQVFTGAIYDILADIFSFEKRTSIRDDAATLYETAKYVCGLVLRAIIAAPASGATFANVANQMLNIALADGKPTQYRTFIRNRFTVRGVVVAATPFAFNGNNEEEAALVAEEHPSLDPNAVPGLFGTCGTMQSPEFTDSEGAFQHELNELRESLRSKKTNGNGNDHHAAEQSKKAEKNRPSGVKSGR